MLDFHLYCTHQKKRLFCYPKSKYCNTERFVYFYSLISRTQKDTTWSGTTVFLVITFVLGCYKIVKLGAIVLSAHSKTSADYFQIDLKTAGEQLSFPICVMSKVLSALCLLPTLVMAAFIINCWDCTQATITLFGVVTCMLNNQLPLKQKYIIIIYLRLEQMDRNCSI